MFYRARYYDPEVGRFISEDPIGFEGKYLNLYRYVGNGVIGLIDPFGLAALKNYVTQTGKAVELGNNLFAIGEVLACSIYSVGAALELASIGAYGTVVVVSENLGCATPQAGGEKMHDMLDDALEGSPWETNSNPDEFESGHRPDGYRRDRNQCFEMKRDTASGHRSFRRKSKLYIQLFQKYIGGTWRCIKVVWRDWD